MRDIPELRSSFFTSREIMAYTGITRSEFIDFIRARPNGDKPFFVPKNENYKRIIKRFIFEPLEIIDIYILNILKRNGLDKRLLPFIIEGSYSDEVIIQLSTCGVQKVINGKSIKYIKKAKEIKPPKDLCVIGFVSINKPLIWKTVNNIMEKNFLKVSCKRR